MREYGVWTDNDGGFTFTQCYSWVEAARERARVILDTEEGDQPATRADLLVMRVCSEHEDQPADGCEECEEWDDETEDDEDDA